MGVLPPAVNLHQAGKVRSAVGISINGGHHGFAAFEYADAVAQDLQDDAVLFPCAEDFDIDWLGPWIKARPRFLKILRRNPGAQRRQGFWGGVV